jgi:Arc/MetJ-type ribon-helix-helix transcriptional regulator
MPFTLTLDTHGEELIAAHLRSGLYRSPEEVVTRALEKLSEQEHRAVAARTMTAAEAVADIRELRKGVRLDGLRIKELIDEGRKY